MFESSLSLRLAFVSALLATAFLATTAPVGAAVPTADPGAAIETPGAGVLVPLETPADASATGDAAATVAPPSLSPAVGVGSVEGVDTAAPPAFMIQATAAIDAGAYDEAIGVLQSGVADLERETARYDTRLIPPLTLLGDAYLASGDYERARETYGSALHIERVSAGLHSPGQAPLVYKEADALVAIGEIEEANARHEYAFEVLERAYGPTSAELVPGLYRLAEWYVATRNIFAARPLYARARDNLERAHGSDSVELVPALRGLAETYRFERFPPYAISTRRQPTFQMTTNATITGSAVAAPEIQINRFSEGERALQEIIAILEKNKAEQPLEYALAVLDLADWNLLFEKWDRAATLYRHVDGLLRDEAKLPDSDVARYLGTPAPLYLPLPGDPDPPPADLRMAPRQGYVELSYTLTERGEVRDLKTLGAEPEGLMDVGVRKAFRSARFRPALDHGAPVAASEQTYRHTFSYYPRRPQTAQSDDGKDA